MPTNRFSDISFQASVDTMTSTTVANEQEFENTGPVHNPVLLSNVYRMDGELQTKALEGKEIPEPQNNGGGFGELFGAINQSISDTGFGINNALNSGLAMNDPQYNQDPNNPAPTQNLAQEDGQRSILDTSLTAAETVHHRAATQELEMKPAWA